jgi:hypothetical protein
MALKKDAIDKIAGLLKIKSADLETAIKAETEVDVAIDDKLQVFTEPEVTTLKNNEYARGKEAGVEMEIKTAKEKLGLEFTGKTIDGLLTAHKTKVIADAKIAPDQKVQELETKVTTLTNTVQEYETKLAAKDGEVSTIKINSELFKYIPAPGENGPALGQDEIVQLMRGNGFEFKDDAGVVKTYKGGVLVADKLGNALPAKDVVTGFLTEKKLYVPEATPGGRGGKDAAPAGGKALTMSELKAQATAKGISLQGEEFGKLYADAAKDKDFDPVK